MNDNLEKVKSIVTGATTTVCVVAVIVGMSFTIIECEKVVSNVSIERLKVKENTRLEKIEKIRVADSIHMTNGYLKVPNINPGSYHWEIKK